jgi:predicted RNA-binding protein YlxR (DUF448 family)
MRIVRTPDGRVVLDETGRLAGRGAYLCRDETCRATALAKGVVRRALAAVPPPEVWTALADACRPSMTKTTMMTTTTNEGGTRGEE